MLVSMHPFNSMAMEKQWPSLPVTVCLWWIVLILTNRPWTHHMGDFPMQVLNGPLTENRLPDRPIWMPTQDFCRLGCDLVRAQEDKRVCEGPPPPEVTRTGTPVRSVTRHVGNSRRNNGRTPPL